MMQTVFKTDKEFEDFKTWTLGLLRDESAKDLCITFTKKDGAQRAMRCTLAESNIPKEFQPKTEGTASTFTDAACRVFDTEISAWRSFRWDSVIKVEVTL